VEILANRCKPLASGLTSPMAYVVADLPPHPFKGGLSSFQQCEIDSKIGLIFAFQSLTGGVQVTHFWNWPFSRLLIDLLFPEIPEQVTPHWNHRKNVHYEKKRLLSLIYFFPSSSTFSCATNSLFDTPFHSQMTRSHFSYCLSCI
jgi:hypothetical protein